MLGSGFCGKRRNILLYHFPLPTNGIFFRVTLLVTNIFQILDLGFGLRGKVLAHTLSGILVDLEQLVSLLLQFDLIGLLKALLRA